MHVAETYRLITWICGAGILVESGELLAHRRMFAPDGLFSWHILRQRQVGAPMWLRTLLDRVVGSRILLVPVLSLRLVATILMMVNPVASFTFAAALALVVASQIWIHFRRAGVGGVGSDDLTLLVSVTTFLCVVVAPSEKTAVAGLWFLTAQLLLAYMVAGVSKFAAPRWRSGEALIAICATEIYGSPWLSSVLRARPSLAKAMCWFVIGWESTFPIIMFVPDSVKIVLLANAALFHLATGHLMGLNTFLPAFVATYPALWAVTR